MFVITLDTGKIISEGRDVPNFDSVPDGITSAQLLMPYSITKQIGNKTLRRNAVVSIGRYDRYYIASQAIANVMAISGDTGQLSQIGQGYKTHDILAGIDDTIGEVLYIKLSLATGDVTIDKFDLDWWIKTYGINPTTFKKGSPRK